MIFAVKDTVFHSSVHLSSSFFLTLIMLSAIATHFIRVKLYSALGCEQLEVPIVRA